MLQVLLLIIPFGLAGAVSPMLLTEQTLLLAGPGGRRAARRFAAGVLLVTLFYIGLLVFFGRAISLPKEPSLSATLDIILGLSLVTIALFIRRAGAKPAPQKKPPRNLGPKAAFGFGAFSMATNFTTLALTVPGAKAIAAGGLVFPERALLVFVLALLVATPAWLPLALTAVAPGPAQRGLNTVGYFIEARGRQATVLLLGGLGLILVLSGILRALSL